MKIKQSFATTLTISTFIVVCITGIFLFFDIKNRGIKYIHDYVGLIFVVIGFLHAFANMSAFKRYFKGFKFKIIISILFFCAISYLILNLNDKSANLISKSDSKMMKKAFLNLNIKDAVIAYKTDYKNIKKLQDAGLLDKSIKEASDVGVFTEKELLYIIINN